MVIAQARTQLLDASGATVVVPEKGLVRIIGTFKDQTDAPIALTSWSALTLTLYAREPKTIINGVDHIGILNIGRMSMHTTDGTFTLTLEGADHSIVDASKDLEAHRALIEGVYGSTKPFKFEIDFYVRNLDKVI